MNREKSMIDRVIKDIEENVRFLAGMVRFTGEEREARENNIKNYKDKIEVLIKRLSSTQDLILDSSYERGFVAGCRHISDKNGISFDEASTRLAIRHKSEV